MQHSTRGSRSRAGLKRSPACTPNIDGVTSIRAGEPDRSVLSNGSPARFVKASTVLRRNQMSGRRLI
jgi:hypothetical protein